MLDFNTRSKITGYTLEDHIAQAAITISGIRERHGMDVANTELNAIAETISGYFNIAADEIRKEIICQAMTEYYGLQPQMRWTYTN